MGEEVSYQATSKPPTVREQQLSWAALGRVGMGWDGLGCPAVTKLVVNIMVKPPTSSGPAAVCSWPNNLKAYDYYSALYTRIANVRLALSEISVIKLCSKPTSAVTYQYSTSVNKKVWPKSVYIAKQSITSILDWRLNICLRDRRVNPDQDSTF
jgi:hypothetical protein